MGQKIERLHLARIARAMLEGQTASLELDAAQIGDLRRWGLLGMIPSADYGTCIRDRETRMLVARLELRNRAVRQRIREAASAASVLLRQEGVDVLPIKGLSTERYYDWDGARRYVDADLFVRGNRVQVAASLRAIGIPASTAASAARLAAKRSLKSINVRYHEVWLDVHFIPTGQFASRALNLPVESYAEWTLEGNPLPSAELDFVIAAVNTIRDAGLTLKSAIDVVKILQQKVLVAERIDVIAREFGLSRIIEPVVATIERDLGITLDYPGSRSDREPLRGVSLFSDDRRSRPKRSGLVALYFGPGRARAAVAAARWLIPSADRIRVDHPYAEDPAWRLRVAQISSRLSNYSVRKATRR